MGLTNPQSLQVPQVIIEYQLPTATNPSIINNASYTTNVLNTVTRNIGTLASLSSNAVTLPAGTYLIAYTYAIGSAAGTAQISSKLELYDGTSPLASSTGSVSTINNLSCVNLTQNFVVTFATSKTITFRQFSEWTVGPSILQGVIQNSGNYGTHATLAITKV